MVDIRLMRLFLRYLAACTMTVVVLTMMALYFKLVISVFNSPPNPEYTYCMTLKDDLFSSLPAKCVRYFR